MLLEILIVISNSGVVYVGVVAILPEEHRTAHIDKVSRTVRDTPRAIAAAPVLAWRKALHACRWLLWQTARAGKRTSAR
jgi:hypothetical protein